MRLRATTRAKTRAKTRRTTRNDLDLLQVRPRVRPGEPEPLLPPERAPRRALRGPAAVDARRVRQDGGRAPGRPRGWRGEGHPPRGGLDVWRRHDDARQDARRVPARERSAGRARREARAPRADPPRAPRGAA